jgi:hypothetical protein
VLLLLLLVLQAGEQLGLRSLQDYCAHLKGTRQAALGVYSFADVQRANASGKVRGDDGVMQATATDLDDSAAFAQPAASCNSLFDM